MTSQKIDPAKWEQRKNASSEDGREYAQGMVFEDKQIIASVVVESDINCKVEVKVMQAINGSDCQNWTARVSSPQQSVEALQVLVKEAIESTAEQSDIAEGISRKMQRKMEECFFKEGVLARDDEGNVLTATVLKNRINNEGNHTKMSNRGMLANMLKAQLRIPPFIGGLPLVGVKTYSKPGAFAMQVFHFLWADSEDSIDAEINVPTHELDIMPVDKLQGKLNDYVKVLRTKHPGDFEVECLDATGEEHRFDEGSRYLAERHLDGEFIWVFDRYGQRGEYSASRFSAVPEAAKKMEPYIPGNTLRTDENGKPLTSPSEPERGWNNFNVQASSPLRVGADYFKDAVIPQGLRRVLGKMNEEFGR